MRKESVYQVHDDDFISAIKQSRNIHEALVMMGLNSRGAAYKTFKARVKKLKIDLSHFINDKNLRKLISDFELNEACKNNISRQSTLKCLKLNPNTGANIIWISKKIELLNINTNHWLGKAHLKNKSHNWSIKKELKDVLIEKSDYTFTTNLKKRLLKAGLMEEKCGECGIIEWHGKKLSLHLEHKNGINNDNRIENLTLLCPNCHSLTETYAGKNINRNKKYAQMT